MKNQKLPTASKLTIVRQLCNYIPIHLVPKLARETGVDEQARTYDEWSHIVTLCYAQVTHSIGLNDVCDALQLNSGPLSAIRGATPPTRNNLSHANRVRDAAMAEELFWAVYDHLGDLEQRGVCWVTRAKENLQFEVVESYPVKEGGKVVCDELVGLKNAGSRKAYPDLMRRIVAWVEVDGKERLMTFLTNHLTWSAESVVELYRCRWRIEVFFKQIKQTLQLADFLGTSANAVRWQVWTALLVYLLLRYLAFLSNWAHSFSRLFAIVRTCLWRKWDLLKLLARYGTAGGSYRYLGRPEQAFFPGFI